MERRNDNLGIAFGGMEVKPHEDTLSMLTEGQWGEAKPNGSCPLPINPTEKPHEIRQALQQLMMLGSLEEPVAISDEGDSGWANTWSRSDHVHMLTSAMVARLAATMETPAAIASTAYTGVSTRFARGDHVHNLVGVDTFTVNHINEYTTDHGIYMDADSVFVKDGVVTATDLKASGDLYANHILEYTSAHGVLIDVLTLIKDGGIDCYQYGSTGPYYETYLARGSAGSETRTQSTDILGGIIFYGYDTSYIPLAGITAYHDATTGASDMPTCMIFSVTADGSATSGEKMRLSNAGRLYLGTAAQLDTYIARTNTGELTVNTKLVTTDLTVGTLAGLLWGTAGVVSATMTPSVTSITVAAGAVGTPSILFTGYTETGWYLIGANNIGLSINATEILDIASTGMTVTGELTANHVTVNGALGDCMRLTYVAPG